MPHRGVPQMAVKKLHVKSAPRAAMALLGGQKTTACATLEPY